MGLIAALSLCLAPGVADAAKKGKKQPPRVATFNLYLGTDLPALANALNPTAPNNIAAKPDSIANAVGFGLKDINANDFNTRAANIARLIKGKKVDLVGLQEAALFRLQVPTDGSGVNPAATRATLPLIDYVDVLLNALNEGAKTKKECGQAAKKRKAQGKKPKPCNRGYRLAIQGNRVDTEFLHDADNDPGPDGVTYDLADSAVPGSCPATPPGAPNGPGCWLRGNDDTGVQFAEPTANQCSDGVDNDQDGDIDYGPTPADGAPPGGNETSGPVFGDATPATGAQGGAPPWDCESRADNSEVDTTPGPGGEPSGLPQDANFDHGVYAGNHASPQNGTPPCPGGVSAECPFGLTYDGGAQGRDAAGINDCTDNSTDTGPALGADPDGGGAIPPWPFAGYDGDEQAGIPGGQRSVCLFHGVDGDLSLTLRDAILVRVGNGVKAKNPQNGLFTNQVSATLPVGPPLSQNRGWVSVDAKVRGKSFHLVNTHLEASDDGTVREDQATELLNGPAKQAQTVLLGDLNSDERNAADPQSPPAVNRLLAAGFRDLVGLFQTSSHATGTRSFLQATANAGLLNNAGDAAVESRIDRILTNSASLRTGASGPLDRFAGGLWTSDHVGVFATLGGGKKKGKKKK